MKLLDLLRKLGIIRWGKTSATYTNAKDKPIELIDNGVFNEQKDLINPSKEEKK